MVLVIREPGETGSAKDSTESLTRERRSTGKENQREESYRKARKKMPGVKWNRGQLSTQEMAEAS